MLINLLIAMLTNIYTLLYPQAFSMHLREIILIKTLYDYDENYGFMISLPFPFSVFPNNLICSLILLCKKKPKIMNNNITFIAYTITYIWSIFFYLICMCLIPFAYFYALIHKGIIIFRRTHVSRVKKLLSMLIFLIFGIFIMLVRFFVDIIIHTK
jgi:hypothetical protein